jgi:hypothetical protein
MIYKIYLKTDNNGLTNETDYSNISRYDAIADFCNDNDCTPDDILVIEIEDEISKTQVLINILNEFINTCDIHEDVELLKVCNEFIDQLQQMN